jgi:hypothetical protein
MVFLFAEKLAPSDAFLQHFANQTFRHISAALCSSFAAKSFSLAGSMQAESSVETSATQMQQSAKMSKKMKKSLQKQALQQSSDVHDAGTPTASFISGADMSSQTACVVFLLELLTQFTSLSHNVSATLVDYLTTWANAQMRALCLDQAFDYTLLCVLLNTLQLIKRTQNLQAECAFQHLLVHPLPNQVASCCHAKCVCFGRSAPYAVVVIER